MDPSSHLKGREVPSDQNVGGVPKFLLIKGDSSRWEVERRSASHPGVQPTSHFSWSQFLRPVVKGIFAMPSNLLTPFLELDEEFCKVSNQ